MMQHDVFRLTGMFTGASFGGGTSTWFPFGTCNTLIKS